MIFTEQKRVDAEEAFEKEMEGVAVTARKEFRQLCAAALAAAAARNATAAGQARQRSRAVAKRSAQTNNEQQPKRSR